ncbi:DNA translocase FtsK 4TM domain-containing protein [Alphaproteobacteria bacterium]|jgi:DNA segregation ATPase FtsK/SpoIIIE, S-DNA-T family|nr:DNA translocase FtsK 4TM domain-containing protein [Alphaproteobacteria bacterium]
MFNYGSFKLLLLKVFLGIFLFGFSLILFVSIYTHNTNDPGIGRLVGSSEISNFFGFWGAVFSSVLLTLYGKASFFLVIFLSYLGVFMFLGLAVKKPILKILLILLSVTLINISLLLQQSFKTDTGLLSKILFDIYKSYFSFLVDGFLYRTLSIISFTLISIILFLYCFSINISFLKNIILKIFSYNLLKPLIVFKLKKEKGFRPKSVPRRKSEPTITKKDKNFLNKTKKNKQISESEFVFHLPETNILSKSNTKISQKKETENINKENSIKLERVLEEYGVVGKIVGYKTGPIVTLYEFIPNAGIKASKVIGLADDIARAMSSVSARISSQPGKTSLGIEIPNLKRQGVMFGDLVDSPKFFELNNCLTLALGKDISGQLVFADLEKMPHLLIAGTTGSGKSVGINTIIMSILYRFKPDECKLILIDPKMLELSIYEDIPHLLTPVVTNPNKAVFALKWVVKEMEERYKLMSSLNVKNINSYNEKSKKILSTGKKLYKNVQTGIDEVTRQPILEKREIPLEKMPFIVVVIDEMADLMMVAGKEVENLIQRLAQMARASGIHLVTATQRPSVDVITGTIKANFPSRLSYKVASKFDSRTILNEMGAEQLLGSGDMLFLENGASLKRLHGGFLSEGEIEKVVNSIREQAVFDQKNEITIEEKNEEGSMGFGFDEGEVDALYTKAVNIVIEQQKVSTSYIQRYLQIGYNRAARIVEKMEDEGLISEANNAGKRQVLRKN